MNRVLALAAVVALFGPSLAGQVQTMSIRSQPVDQALLAFAETAGISLVVDETVRGTVSLVLHNQNPERCIEEIAAAAGVYLRRREGVLQASRVKVHQDETGRWFVDSSGGSLPVILRQIAEASPLSVVAPEGPVNSRPLDLHISSPTLVGALEAVAETVELDLTQHGGLLRFSRRGEDPVLNDHRHSIGTVAVRPHGAAGDDGVLGLTIDLPRGTQAAVLHAVARSFQENLILCGELFAPVEPVSFSASSEEEFLTALGAATGCELYRDGASILAVQSYERRLLEPYYHREVLRLPEEHRSALESILGAAPALAVQGSIAGGLLVAGLDSSIAAARRTIDLIRRHGRQRSFLLLQPEHRSPEAIRSVLGLQYPGLDLEVIPDLAVIAARVPPGIRGEIGTALELLDTPVPRRRYSCRFVDPATAIEAVRAEFPHLSPVAQADGRGITLVADPIDHTRVSALLLHLDQPRQQLRFDLCIVQFQAGRAARHGIDATAARDGITQGRQPPLVVDGAWSGVLTLNFDFISALGYRGALALSDELSSNQARLVLDTSLRALCGETARLENSSTFRYRDVLGEEDHQAWRSVVREIESGLDVQVAGTLHADRSMTVTIRVALSRQGTDVRGDGTPPPTSQRMMESTVRVHAGEPLVIGGLLHQEESRSENRFPILGRLPIIRRLVNRWDKHQEETELVLYLTAYPEPPMHRQLRVQQQVEALSRLLEGGL